MLDRRIGAQKNKTHALIRQVFNFGVFSERCEFNPTALIAKPGADRPPAMASERLGIQPIVVSRVLGQSSETGGAAAVTLTHCALHSYMPEKRRALRRWENLLMKIVGEKGA